MGFLEEEGIKAVCFDIDGTFYPQWKTEFNIARASLCALPFAFAYNKARQRVRTEDCFLNLPVVDNRKRGERMCRYMWDRTDEETVSYFLEKEERIFFKRYEKLFLTIKPYPGVKEVLSRLKEGGYAMGVLSDFPVGTKLKAMGIESYFKTIISSEDLGRYKPCLTLFRVLSERMDIDSHAILYVGDSQRKDIEGARCAGFRSALLSKKKEKTSADLCVCSWEELRDKLF